MQSRHGTIYEHLTHISDELSVLSSKIILDGELYTDKIPFSDLTGLINKININKEDSKNLKLLEYIVYDLVDSIDYSDRYSRLVDIFNTYNFKYVKLIQTTIIDNPDNVESIHSKFVDKGYEGLILRNTTGKYKVNSRSFDLQKYKHFNDSEFEIVGFTEGKGKEKGHIIWICKVSDTDKSTFTVRPIGDSEERQYYFKNAKKYIGKMLTVKYFGFTNRGKPRMPVAISIRDYE